MLVSKIISVFTQYRETLKGFGIEAHEIKDNDSLASRFSGEEKLAHLAWMCARSIEFASTGGVDKAFRWLGFVQGVLWMSNIYTINELRDHSRPDK